MIDMQSKEPMAMCPMASMCKTMVNKTPSPLILMAPGLVFIVVGVLILLEPRVLVWLAAAVTILLGIALLMMATWFRRLATRLRSQ